MRREGKWMRQARENVERKRKKKKKKKEFCHDIVSKIISLKYTKFCITRTLSISNIIQKLLIISFHQENKLCEFLLKSPIFAISECFS